MTDYYKDYPITITIDNREGKIITELETNPLFSYNKANLDIGDFRIVLDKTQILIERKTVDDLIASIKDGRYKEQKYRLMNEHRNNVKVIYLIEGDIWKTKKFKPDTLFSVIVNTMIRDNIFVYISKDVAHTILFIHKIYKQLDKNKESFISSGANTPGANTPGANTPGTNTPGANTPGANTPGANTPGANILEDTSYAQYIKPNKKSNITPKICFINQLRQIPGVSYTIATVIADKYETMKILLTLATRDELLQLKVNNRRISTTIVDSIIN